MSYRQQIAQFEKRSVLLFAALALGAAGTAFAQSTAASAGGDAEIAAAFKQADKNADGSLSMEEAQSMPAVSEQYKAIDTHGDGTISMAEFTTAMRK